jgi:1-acyl-sn-glycerol-3-phosphate acyltransferase
MFYIRTILMGIWVIIICIIFFFKSLLRWGDTNLDRDFARMFAQGTLKVTDINIEVTGQENMIAEQPCIYTGNHQSNFDVAVYGSVCPGNTVAIGKKELVWIPLFGIFCLAAGNIMIDRKKTDKAISALTQIVEEIKTRKVSVWIFPEGTRNKSGEGLLPFKKGAFHMAIAAQIPIVPLVASPISRVADWKKRIIKGGTIQVKVLPPIPTIGLTEEDVGTLASQVREQMLQALSEVQSIPKSE